MKALSPTLAFGLRFLVYFALLMLAFEASRGTFVERFLVVDCILRPTTALIQAAAPEEQVTLVGRTISSPASSLHVTRGCEGVEIFLLLVAAVVAFPAPWKARLRGLGVGCVLAYLLSVTRLLALHFTLRYTPGAWEALHGLVLPLGPIIVVTLYFMRWSAAQPMHAH
jgi:exosortase family protein XrtM